MKGYLYSAIKTFAAVLFLFSLTAYGQERLLSEDLSGSFRNFDVIRVDAGDSLAANGETRALRIAADGRTFDLVLTPRDLRPVRYRAEDTFAGGVRQLPRGAVTTFRGYVAGDTGSSVRLNLDGERIEGFFKTAGTRYYIEPAANYSRLAGRGEMIVYKAEDYLGDGDFDCHSDLMRRIKSGKEMVVGQNPLAGLTGAGVIEMATDADRQFVNSLGGAEQANAEILNILNMVEGTFDDQLNLTIQVVFQHTWTTADPYNGASPSTLNDSFRLHWEANYPQTEYPRDVAHLFSAKQNVLSQGYAYIGVICSSPAYAYGISGRIDWAPGKYLMTAHELGHNLGGNHAEAAQNCGNTVMNAALSGSTPLLFCEFSQNEIGSFTGSNGSCLAPPSSGSAARFDFDGDSRTDVGIYRPARGEWWYLRSGDGANRAFQFGTNSDRMVPADYTGDGKTDVAFWRESTGEVFILRSEDSSFYSFPFGAAGDVPAPGDYDGDGTADFAVFRAGTWYILQSSGGVRIDTFGSSGDVPVVGDYDGDGADDPAIFRPGVHEWWIKRSTAGVLAMQFGAAGDKPVPADYTGDGKTDIAFWRPAGGEWFVVRSEDQSFYSAPFGANGDVPVAGDYDGDGTADLAVWRPSDRTWYLLRSQSGFTAVGFGSQGDVPVPASFVP